MAAIVLKFLHLKEGEKGADYIESSFQQSSWDTDQ
jgi:hypothetical protein